MPDHEGRHRSGHAKAHAKAHARKRRRRRGGPVARFVEPAVLLLLREGNAHGYELADELTAFMPVQRVDVGNLYRLLRKLEDDGLVASEWDEGEAGRAKRVYEITDDGIEALDDWAERLRGTAEALTRFLARHDAGRERTPSDNEGAHDTEPDETPDSGVDTEPDETPDSGVDDDAD